MRNIMFIGAGALGIMYADHIQRSDPSAHVYFIADPGRIERYMKEGFFCNGKRTDFMYLPSGAGNTEQIYADLLVFSVKTYDLDDAVEAVRPYVKPETVVVSVMNGISSEEIIRERLNLAYVLDALAMGASVMRSGNHVDYSTLGLIYIGAHDESQKDALDRTEQYFDSIGLPYEHHEDIRKKLWEKFMTNVGNNQASAVYRVPFGPLTDPDEESYKVAHGAIYEVVAVAKCYGVEITQEDIAFWENVAANLGAENKSSMLQDVEAGRRTEVEHFAGEVIRRGRLNGIPTPVNEMIYEKLSNTR